MPRCSDAVPAGSYLALVRVQEWRPDTEIEAKSKSAIWGGVGRKP